MDNLILIGFSGTGKSAVGKEVARRLRTEFVDTDTLITQKLNKSIARIFKEDGETVFRAVEQQVVFDTCGLSGIVIATGGGSVTRPSNLEEMLRSGTVICLESSVNTIFERLFPGEGSKLQAETIRPLVQGDNPREAIREIKSSRQEFYSSAHWTVHTDKLTISESAQEVIHAWGLLNRGTSGPKFPLDSLGDEHLAAVVYSSTGPSYVYAGRGLLNELGTWCGAHGLMTKAYLFSDDNVLPLYGSQARSSLEEAGIPTMDFAITAGETSKNLRQAMDCYHWLAESRAERKDFLLALGGGVVGDLGGFIAGTFNRGMPFVQIPTTLIGMVDASIGGKVAVDLPHGKNLVGLFYQPRFVLADVETLMTLPKREMASGWAEAIKHGFIVDTGLLDMFESEAMAIQRLEDPIVSNVIRRSMGIKAEIVSRDEYETLGFRSLLNYGHTIGHALEAASGYKKLLHGEAIAVGMAAAARISHGMGFIRHEVVARHDRLLDRFGLPRRCPGVDLDAVRWAMMSDKKIDRGSIQWVLLEEEGKAVLRSDVPMELVDRVLRDVT